MGSVTLWKSEAGLGVGINYEGQMREELSVCSWGMPKLMLLKNK